MSAHDDLARIENMVAAYGSADVSETITRLTEELRLLREVRDWSVAVDTGAFESEAWRKLREAQRAWREFVMRLDAQDDR